MAHSFSSSLFLDLAECILTLEYIAKNWIWGWWCGDDKEFLEFFESPRNRDRVCGIGYNQLMTETETNKQQQNKNSTHSLPSTLFTHE